MVVNQPMGTAIKIIGAVAIVVASFLATDWLIEWYSPSCPVGGIELKRPFLQSGRYSFVAVMSELKDESDSVSTPKRSRIRLCENAQWLGPPHSVHAEIDKIGLGKFSHWGEAIIFSSSDNRDPNTNGRTYWIAR
jgi:hypothetical protein